MSNLLYAHVGSLRPFLERLACFHANCSTHTSTEWSLIVLRVQLSAPTAEFQLQVAKLLTQEITFHFNDSAFLSSGCQLRQLVVFTASLVQRTALVSAVEKAHSEVEMSIQIADKWCVNQRVFLIEGPIDGALFWLLCACVRCAGADVP